MSPIVVASIVFLCVLAGTLAGMYLRDALPGHHLGEESKEAVKLGIGMIATMTALILGLMTASAKSSFDGVDASVKRAGVDGLALDRALAGFGPETKPIRDDLRTMLEYRLRVTWPEDPAVSGRVDAPEGTPKAEGVERQIVDLSADTPAQRWYQSQALSLASDMLQTRLIVFGATGSSVSTIFLVVVVVWLALIFGSFGLFAPRNATVLIVFVVCALSVAASVFLILEMDQPFDGVMKVSSAPFQYTLANLGK